VGLSRETVQRFVEADEFPERRERAPRTPLFAPYEPYLRERWAAGCQESATLWREIRAQGYTGSASGLRQHLRQWRTTPARSGPRPKRLARTHAPAPPKRRTFSVRQVKWLLLRAPVALGAGEAAFLDHLRTLCPEIDTTYRLAHEFKRLVRERDQAALDLWLAQAAHSHIKEMEGFAGGIRKDRAAIDAALTTEWSNGQLEGGVNKLKTLKRQMYGRAGFDLLRQRTLYAA
jgi:transposase